MSRPQRSTVLARLAVRLGANVVAGQDVVVFAFDVEYAPLVREIAEQAYLAGARYVSVLYWDQHVKRSRLLHAPEESLDLTPAWWDRHIEECIEKRSAYIIVRGDAAPEFFADVDLARAARDRMPVTVAAGQMIRSGEVNWTVIPGPSLAAAARVLGAEDLDAYWDLLGSFLRLDEDDPEAKWRAHIAGAARARGHRSKRTDSMVLRFYGGETDLRARRAQRRAVDACLR